MPEMQDPLFHLIPDKAHDLHDLFGPLGGQPGDQKAVNDQTADENEQGSATLDSEEAHKMEEIIEETKKEEAPKGTLEERIKEVEKSYNETAIPIYGNINKRLVTLARSLADKNLLNHAKQIISVADSE